MRHFLLVLIALAGLARAEEVTLAVPFGLGERIEFAVGWGLINAGTSTLTVQDTVRVDDHLCYEIESRARSNDVLGTLYPVDDRVVTRMDVEGLFSRGLSKRLREGTYKKDREFLLRPEAGKILKMGEEGPRDSLDFRRPVQDVLSAFYWVRTQNFKVGDVLEVEAMDNLKTYRLAVKVLGREKVKVKAGTFDCFKIQPVLLGEGLFKAKGEVFIWVTADEARIPVMMKSKIFIGSISAKMISYSPASTSSDSLSAWLQGR